MTMGWATEAARQRAMAMGWATEAAARHWATTALWGTKAAHNPSETATAQAAARATLAGRCVINVKIKKSIVWLLGTHGEPLEAMA